MTDKKYLVTAFDMTELVTDEVQAYGFNPRELAPFEVPNLQIPRWVAEWSYRSFRDVLDFLEQERNEVWLIGLSGEELDKFDQWINENSRVNVSMIVEAYLNPLTRNMVEVIDD